MWNAYDVSIVFFDLLKAEKLYQIKKNSKKNLL